MEPLPVPSPVPLSGMHTGLQSGTGVLYRQSGIARRFTDGILRRVSATDNVEKSAFSYVRSHV